MQTRIASLLEVGLHFKGARCLRCLRCLYSPPCQKNPNAAPAPSTPSQQLPLLRRDGETEARSPGSPIGKPARPFATSAQPNYPPPSSSSSSWVVPALRAIARRRARRRRAFPLPQFTHLPPRRRRDAGHRRETPARPPSSRLCHASPCPSLAGELDEPDPLPRALGGLIGSLLARSRRELGQVPGGISKA